jgi:tetratricopeptide (TPR) repeat protein
LDRNGKGADALEVRRRIAKDSPDDYLTRASIAAEYERQGRTPDAIVFYEEVVRIAGVPTPVMSNYRLKLAALYEKNGQKQEAIGQYREVKKADAGNKSALDALKRLGAP